METRFRTSIVCIHNDKLLTFKAVDPHDGREFFLLPGGKIENGETAPEAAIRETLEETGYQVTIETSSAIEREYSFHWNGQEYSCFTLFYRAHLKTPFAQLIKDQSYNHGVVWIPKEEISSQINYHPDILSAILELI